MLAGLLVHAIRTAALGSVDSADGLRALHARALLAPVWTLAIAGAAVRAGSTALADVRGANAVAGLSLARGPGLTVAGVWLLFAATALTLATRPVPDRSLPELVKRLDALGVLAEAVLAVTLFLGPQISAPADAVWWVLGVGALGAGAFFARRADRSRPAPPVVSLGMAAVGLALVLIGGAP